MEEKHTCNCSSKTDDDYLKKLELIAKGSYSERTMKAMFISLIIFCCILVISISAVAIYGINMFHHYMMNTEVVESVTVTEEIIGDKSSDDYNANGHIIQGNNFTNSTMGVNNGESEQDKK